MLQRPLALIVISYIIGILTAHSHPPKFLAFALLFIGIYLLTFPITRRSSYVEVSALIAIFLATGIIISYPKRQDPRLIKITSMAKRYKFEATVLSPISLRNGVAKLNVMIQRAYIGGSVNPVQWKTRMTIYNNPPDLFPGQKILFSAVPRPFRNFKNPGNFNYEADMRHKGFTFSTPISDGRRIVALGKGTLPWPLSVSERLRRSLRKFFHASLQGSDLAIYSAIVLGERNLISTRLREKFSRTGLSHILAVSGLHIGLVAWLAFFFVKTLLSFSRRTMLRIDIRKASAIVTCIPILLYVTVSGFQVSATRAMIMALAYLWSLILGREKEIWSTLCLSALVILAIQPEAIFHISFQLSYLAVIGLVWLCPPVFRVLNPVIDRSMESFPSTIKKSAHYLTSLLIITLIATIFLLPLTTYYFHRISLVAFAANFAVVPILGLMVIPSGLLAAISFVVFPSLAKLILLLGSQGLHVIMWIVTCLGSLPYASVWSVTPTLLEMGVFYAIVFCITFWGKNKWPKIALITVCAVGLTDAGYWISKTRFNPDLKVSFLDVGQGNCALIEFPKGKKMLIDGGGFFGDTFDVGKMVVAPFLWSQKISKLDYLVLTHPQADHMNGLRFVARAFAPEVFFYNGERVEEKSFHELINILKSKGIGLIVPTPPADHLAINGASVKFFMLGPNAVMRPSANTANNRSLITQVRYGDYSILFPGDIEKEAERILAQLAGRELESQILLSPHHGSNTSSSMIFLEAIRPRICVISCRRTSRLRFPDKAVISRLKKMGCIVFSTDTDGMIRVTVKQHEAELATFKSHFRPIYLLTSASNMHNKS